MQKKEKKPKQLVSDAVREMAEELAREYKIPPLRPGEVRPDGWYSVDHYTGRPVKG